MNPPAYPALYDPASQTPHSLHGIDDFEVGRHENADLKVRDLSCSRQQFRIVRLDGRHYVEPYPNTTNPTCLNGQTVRQRTPLQHGDHLEVGQLRFLFHARPPERKEPAVPNDPTIFVNAVPPGLTEIAGADALAKIPTVVEALRPIKLTGRMLIGRDRERVQIPLLHPQVSRIHAHLTMQNERAVLVDLNSANGTFVNGRRLRGPATLKPGDGIDIGPYALLFDGKALLPRTRSDNIELTARAVRRVVKDRATGQALTLLDDVTLVVRPREFVCLLGPAGCGKSTLLNALSGRLTPDGGRVLVNGQDLHTHFDALKRDIVVVPQKNILHEALSVGDALWYTAGLRLPPDLAAREVKQCIDETLHTVSLQERRGTLIRHLSGGQTRRACLANEIMSKPSLLFLDEVTSGLDEQSDCDMMTLFRKIADSGKTVVCITHSLANVERTCHLVVVLTPGGRLAFAGKPEEALQYFAIARLGDVYDCLKREKPEHWQQKFKNSPLYTQYVGGRLPRQEDKASPPVPVSSRKLGEQVRLFRRQTLLLTRRYFAIWRGDYAALAAMLGQSILVAVLLGVLFGNVTETADALDRAQRSVNLLFLLGVTSFWFGCNNAAKEIVKERTIAERERDFNVLAPSYYFSKLLLLALFSGLQTLVLAAISCWWCGEVVPFVRECEVLLSLAATGVTVGLAVSVAARTEEMAITLIPVAVIPQIIFAGVIAPLSGLSKFLSRTLIAVYWGNRGLESLLSEETIRMTRLEEQGSLWTALALLGAHACVFAVAALVMLSWQGRRSSLLGRLVRRAKTT